MNKLLSTSTTPSDNNMSSEPENNHPDLTKRSCLAFYVDNGTNHSSEVWFTTRKRAPRCSFSKLMMQEYSSCAQGSDEPKDY